MWDSVSFHNDFGTKGNIYVIFSDMGCGCCADSESYQSHGTKAPDISKMLATLDEYIVERQTEIRNLERWRAQVVAAGAIVPMEYSK